MKTVKAIQTIVIVFIVSIFIGCSDSDTITSSGKWQTQKGDYNQKEFGNQLARPLYHGQTRLKPRQSYVFNSASTSLSRINTLDVKDITPGSIQGKSKDDCSNLKITGGVDKYTFSCHEKGLNEKEITIENTSNYFIDLDVVMTGLKIDDKPSAE